MKFDCRAGLLLALSAAAFAQSDANWERVQAAERLYFRDIHEFPMDVEVTTVVTDTAGRSKQRSHGVVGFVFRQYDPKTETRTFYTESSVFQLGLRRESLTGHNVVLHSSGILHGKLGDGETREVRAPLEAGKAWVVEIGAKQCDPFTLWPGSLLPKMFCGANEYRLKEEAGGGLVFEHFRLESRGLPSGAKIPYLGSVQLIGFTGEEDFQKAYVAGDEKPFLLPRNVVSTFVTDRGKVVITNVYGPKKKR